VIGGDRVSTIEDAGGTMLALDQTRDSMLTIAVGPLASVRMLSVRCQEAQTQGSASQDYTALAADPAGSSIVFCVCDGVGSSYSGGFAARRLGDRLVSWLRGLQGLPEAPRPIQAMAEELAAELNRFAQEAHAELLREEIAAEAQPLVREVLQELRASHGSETVFLGGRVDHGRPAKDGEAATTTMLLCWMGNVAAQVIPCPPELADAREFEDDGNRWSTARGCKGELAVGVWQMEALERLIVYTDGLASVRERLSLISDDELRSVTEHLLASPRNDDMTLLDLCWSSARYPAADQEGDVRRG
jgi:Protein phosphatase 2C